MTLVVRYNTCIYDFSNFYLFQRYASYQLVQLVHARRFFDDLSTPSRPYPMLYVVPAAKVEVLPTVSAIDVVSDLLAGLGRPLIEVVVHVHVVDEGTTFTLPDEYQAFDSGCGVDAGVTAEGHAMYVVRLAKRDVVKNGGFSRSFLSRMKSGLLNVLSSRLNRGRIVVISCPSNVLTTWLRVILDQYWNLFPLDVQTQRPHGLDFLCSNGCVFKECNPDFARSSLMAKEFLCEQCIVAEGEAFREYQSTVSRGDFVLDKNYILNVRKVKEADEEHCFFPWGDIQTSKAQLFDMTTDARGNDKALRWLNVRFRDLSQDDSSNVNKEGVVDAFTQLAWCWSAKRRFYLATKTSIAKDSIIAFYGGSITAHADVLDDCLFEAHVSKQDENRGYHKVPFMVSCVKVRNEASFLACCGVGERANVRTSFVKGRRADGRLFCGIAFVAICNISAGSGLAYRYVCARMRLCYTCVLLNADVLADTTSTK